MIKGYIRPLQSAELTASPPGDAMLHGTSNRHFIYTAGSSNRIFSYKNQQLGPTTDGGFPPESLAGPSDARRMEGGVAGLR